MKRVVPLLLFLIAAPAQADVDHDEALAAVQRGEILPLPRITEIAKADTPGTVIDVKLDEDDGVYVYEIEIIDAAGRMMELKVDAASGTILERDLDDD